MKKYVVLALVTVVAISGVVLYASLGEDVETAVSTYRVKPGLLEQTVSCNGKVEAVSTKNVYTDWDCVADEVYIKSGQKVEKGDVLFTVDVDATKTVMATAGGMSAEQISKVSISGELTAPVTGVVTALNVKAGQATNAKKPCVVITASDTVQVRVAIPESKLKEVQVGQKAKVHGSAFQKEAYEGKISSISPVAYQLSVGGVSTTVVDAVVELVEQDESLRIGLTAKADVVVDSTEDGFVVPYEYVLQDHDGNEYVYLLVNGRAKKQVIKTGAELSEGFQVLEGLQADDRVIAEPQRISKDGAAVKGA